MRNFIGDGRGIYSNCMVIRESEKVVGLYIYTLGVNAERTFCGDRVRIRPFDTVRIGCGRF